MEARKMRVFDGATIEVPQISNYRERESQVGTLVFLVWAPADEFPHGEKPGHRGWRACWQNRPTDPEFLEVDFREAPTLEGALEAFASVRDPQVRKEVVETFRQHFA